MNGEREQQKQRGKGSKEGLCTGNVTTEADSDEDKDEGQVHSFNTDRALTKGLAGSPEGTATLCLPVNRILLGPFHRCNNSGKKTMGSTLHPGYRVPAPIPVLALKAAEVGQAACPLWP